MELDAEQGRCHSARSTKFDASDFCAQAPRTACPAYSGQHRVTVPANGCCGGVVGEQERALTSMSGYMTCRTWCSHWRSTACSAARRASGSRARCVRSIGSYRRVGTTGPGGAGGPPRGAPAARRLGADALLLVHGPLH